MMEMVKNIGSGTIVALFPDRGGKYVSTALFG